MTLQSSAKRLLPFAPAIDHLCWHQVEVFPVVLHIYHAGVLALPLGCRLLLLLLLGLLPLLAGSSSALLLLPLTHLGSSLLGQRRVYIIRWAGHLEMADASQMSSMNPLMVMVLKIQTIGVHIIRQTGHLRRSRWNIQDLNLVTTRI